MSSNAPFENPAATPGPAVREPWSLALLGAGLLAGIYLRWRGGPVADLDKDLRREAARLAPGRVWTVFAHTFREEDFVFRFILEERGRRFVKHVHEGTVLELYELNPLTTP